MNADFWIAKLNLEAHPEGGFFKRFYTSDEQMQCSDNRGDRPSMTAIWYLLKNGEKSALHILKSDEIWFFHAGNQITIHLNLLSGEKTSITLGANGVENHNITAVIPKNTWFWAETSGEEDFALVSCTVSPGFDFRDFEMK